MRLGVHCDVRGGYPAALRYAEARACRAMQILTYKRHHVPEEDELARFRTALAASAVETVVLHVRFLPSLASADADRRRRSVELLRMEMRYAAGLGGGPLVLHAGAYGPGADARTGRRLFGESVKAACEKAGQPVDLVVENVPGGGRRMGGSLEELAELVNELERRGVGAAACLDTAHAWAYGYGLDTAEGMTGFIRDAEALLGPGRIPVFHLNDSRAERGSHVESHWVWGGGRLGTEGLRALLAMEAYAESAGIIETAPASGTDDDSLAVVRSLAAV